MKTKIKALSIISVFSIQTILITSPAMAAEGFGIRCFTMLNHQDSLNVQGVYEDGLHGEVTVTKGNIADAGVSKNLDCT